MLAAVPTGASDRLATAVGGWLATPSAHATHDELGERLLVTRAIINQLELSFARDAAAFSTTADPERDDNPVAWIREQCRMTVSAAVNATLVGEQEDRLPRSIEALLAGRIGLSYLGLLARTAEFAAQRPHPVAFDEAALLHKAQRLNLARFRDQCYHAEHAMDAAECVASAVLEVEYRRLRLYPGDGGCLSFSGTLDAEVAFSCARLSSRWRRSATPTSTGAASSALPTRWSSSPPTASTPARSRSEPASAPMCR